MSEASRQREAERRMKPVKFFVVGMTASPDGKAQVSFFSDMTIAEIQAVHKATKDYLSQRVESEFKNSSPDISVKTE